MPVYYLKPGFLKTGNLNYSFDAAHKVSCIRKRKEEFSKEILLVKPYRKCLVVKYDLLISKIDIYYNLF